MGRKKKGNKEESEPQQKGPSGEGQSQTGRGRGNVQEQPPAGGAQSGGRGRGRGADNREQSPNVGPPPGGAWGGRGVQAPQEPRPGQQQQQGPPQQGQGRQQKGGRQQPQQPGQGQQQQQGPPPGSAQQQQRGPPQQAQAWQQQGGRQQPQQPGYGQPQQQGPPQQGQAWQHKGGRQQPQQPGQGQQQQQGPPSGYAQQQQRGPPPGYVQQQQQGPPQQAQAWQQQGGRSQPQQPGYVQPQPQQQGPPQQAQGRQQQGGGRQTPQAPQQQPGGRQQQPPQQRPSQGAQGGGDVQAVTSSMATTKISSGGGGDGIKILDKISRAGTKGRRIPVYTNHFEMSLGRVKKVIHYDVDIQPDTPKRLLKDVFQLFRRAYFEKCNPAFDGRKNAYSPKELPFGDAVSGTVVFEEQGMRSREYKVKMQKVNVVDLESINRFLNQAHGNRILDAPMEAIQALDIVLRHSLLVRNINVGRSFFTPSTGNGIIDLGNGMEMYRGFFQSVSLGWKPFLNVDVANKAFPKTQSVINLIKELCSRADLNRGLERWDSESFSKFIKGLRVEYNLPNKPSLKKRFRVNGIYGSAVSIKFDYKNDQGATRNVTIQEYYRFMYNTNLQYPNLPCLWVGAMNKEQKTYLPCEFCTILPGQAVNRKLEANQTREMIKQCATNTDVRKNSIKTSLERANYNNDPTVIDFDLHIANDFLKLDARVLEPPNLKYNQGVVPVRKGVWNATQFLESSKIERWTILNLDGRTRQDALENLAKFLNNGSRQVGMMIGPPTKPYQEIKTFRNNRLSSDLAAFFQKNKHMQIIFVVIPEEDKVYNYVKQAAELAVGCLTQCLKAVTVFRKMNPATIGNILLKVNAKLNGANHTLNIRPPIMNAPTMIMGADVTHPSPDSRDIPSVAAVTASHDPKAFKYNICWRLQPPTVEIIEDLENITLEQMRFFCQKTNVWPQRIVFYRDGVSDGQFQQVLQAELQAIRRACSRVNQNCKPAITFIVVQKRHHTRFFPANPRDSEDRNNNVPAGTCVDTEIVHPTRQNFFLVSHASIQGVAKPTKYVTLWDDNDFNTDDLESLTYHLCHMFARCTRSVSYPAPTYYAHLAAARAKVYIETSQLNMNRLTDEQNKLQIKEEIVKGLPMFFV